MDPFAQASRFAASPSVGQHYHVARLNVRRGMLDQAEVVAGRVMEAVEADERRV